MTPDEIVEYAKQAYNATGDDFFSTNELYKHIWYAQNILARECNAIENTYQTTTVADQQEYSFPTRALAIKAASYDGKNLKRLNFKDFKRIFMENPTSTGTPVAFSQWDRTIYLGPIPNDALDLDLFTFDTPAEVSSTSSLDTEEDTHLGIANYLIWRMALKDQNFQLAAEYKALWDEEKARCLATSRKKLVAGGFNVVVDEDLLNFNYLGTP